MRTVPLGIVAFAVVLAIGAAAPGTPTKTRDCRDGDQPVLSGVVVRERDADGQTLGELEEFDPLGGATVLLRWNNWQDPRRRTSAGAEPTDAELVAVAGGIAGSDGRFDLSFRPTSAMRRAAERNSGNLNFDLHILTPDNEFAIWSFSATWGDRDWNAVTGASPEGEVWARVRYDEDGELLNGTDLGRRQARAYVEGVRSMRGCAQPLVPE